MLEFKTSLFPMQSYYGFRTLQYFFFFWEIRTFILWKRAVSNLSFCFSTEESQMCVFDQTILLKE